MFCTCTLLQTYQLAECFKGVDFPERGEHAAQLERNERVAVARDCLVCADQLRVRQRGQAIALADDRRSAAPRNLIHREPVPNEIERRTRRVSNKRTGNERFPAEGGTSCVQSRNYLLRREKWTEAGVHVHG